LHSTSPSWRPTGSLLTLLSSIGAQEYELAGEYHLNHAIHGLQLAGLWGIREVILISVSGMTGC
jgi:hypothetical protein